MYAVFSNKTTSHILCSTYLTSQIKKGFKIVWLVQKLGQFNLCIVKGLIFLLVEVHGEGSTTNGATLLSIYHKKVMLEF